MLDETWKTNIKDPKKQPRYASVVNCKYCSVLGSYHDWVLMTFQDKGTDEADFKEVHQIVLKGMAQNMSVLVKEGNIGAISCDHAAQENFYVVQFLSDPYTFAE